MKKHTEDDTETIIAICILIILLGYLAAFIVYCNG